MPSYPEFITMKNLFRFPFWVMIILIGLILSGCDVLNMLGYDIKPAEEMCLDRSSSVDQDLPAPDPAALTGVIYFLSDRDNAQGEIYRIPAGGGTAARLTENDISESGLTISPDGTRLAFAAQGNVYQMELACAERAEGCGQADWRLLAEGVTDPAWSPDGKMLAVTVPLPNSPVSGGSADIALLDLASGELTRLNIGKERDCADCGVMVARSPSWAPDGRLVYYLWPWPNSSGQWNLRTVDEDLHENVMSYVAGKEETAPVFSPDQTQAVWADNGVCWFSAESGQPVTLWTPGQTSVQTPVFSPDGGTLAFTADSSGQLEIFVMSVPAAGTVNRGSGQLNLTQNPANDWSPIWIP